MMLNDERKGRFNTRCDERCEVRDTTTLEPDMENVDQEIADDVAGRRMKLDTRVGVRLRDKGIVDRWSFWDEGIDNIWDGVCDISSFSLNCLSAIYDEGSRYIDDGIAEADKAVRMISSSGKGFWGNLNDTVDNLNDVFVQRVDKFANNNSTMRDVNVYLNEVRAKARRNLGDVWEVGKDAIKMGKRKIEGVGELITDERLAKYLKDSNIGKVVTKFGGKIARKIGGEVVESGIGFVAKKAPIGGLVYAGAMPIRERIDEGDYELATLEGASAAAGCVPGWGTLASAGIDGCIFVEDVTGVQPLDHAPISYAGTPFYTTNFERKLAWENLMQYSKTGDCEYLREWRSVDDFGGFLGMVFYPKRKALEDCTTKFCNKWGIDLGR